MPVLLCPYDSNILCPYNSIITYVSPQKQDAGCHHKNKTLAVTAPISKGGEYHSSGHIVSVGKVLCQDTEKFSDLWMINKPEML